MLLVDNLLKLITNRNVRLTLRAKLYVFIIIETFSYIMIQLFF